MVRLVFTAFLGAVLSIGFAAAQDSSSLKFCRDSGCQNCPVAPASSAGFPHCATFDTNEFFREGNFTRGTHNGYSISVNVPAPQAGCATILRQSLEGVVGKCGNVIGIWQNAACTTLELTSNTFMTQFCCGTEDCQNAGVIVASHN